jgi:UDP-N-acetyl-D-glucosamine dehydrogenase
MELLGQQGAVLSYCDPHVPVLPSMRHFDVPKLKSESLTPDYLGSLDCTLIATDHSSFDWDMVVRHSRIVVDTRNATHAVAPHAKNVWKA